MRSKEEIEAFLLESEKARLPLLDFQIRAGKLSAAEREAAEEIWGGRVHVAYWQRGEAAALVEETRRNYLRESVGKRAIR